MDTKDLRALRSQLDKAVKALDEQIKAEDIRKLEQTFDIEEFLSAFEWGLHSTRIYGRPEYTTHLMGTPVEGSCGAESIVGGNSLPLESLLKKQLGLNSLALGYSTKEDGTKCLVVALYPADLRTFLRCSAVKFSELADEVLEELEKDRKKTIDNANLIFDLQNLLKAKQKEAADCIVFKQSEAKRKAREKLDNAPF